MITAEQANRIVIDRLEERPPSVLGPEADEFRAGLERDIALARERGWTIALPAE